jgi:hypothetical protein
MAVLLANAAVTGETLPIGRSGEYVFSVDGTFGGATVALKLLSPDGVSWLTIEDASFTAEGACVVMLGNGNRVRAEVSGGAPSALYASLN